MIYDWKDTAGWTVWAAAIGGLLLLGTAGCVTPRGAYVEADRRTYEAVAPEYRIYVQRDAALTAEQKARRFRTLAAWGDRVERAEGGE